jgi:predicted oxidoreductase (fatty acid repression mutant protein)
LVVTILTRHIERLEAQLEEALKRVADRDQIAAQRDLISAQVDALRSVLDIEKQRTEEWKAVADRFATQAEKLGAAAQVSRGWWPWRRAS